MFYYVKRDLSVQSFLFSTIPDFMNEVKNEIQDLCPLNLRQVETFLENYSCSSNILSFKRQIHFMLINSSIKRCNPRFHYYYYDK